ncbi:hypothetical protein ACVIGB_000713 [Bradyrhizobium sp. USDA 4341]
MALASEPLYPAQRWIRMMDVNGPQPAYAPLAEVDALEAYAPFLHTTEEDARKELDADIAEHAQEIEDGERDEDDELEDYILPCIVHEDGRIEFDGREMSRAAVFEAYAMTDTASPAPC